MAAKRKPSAEEKACPDEPGKCNQWMPRHKRKCRNPAGAWTEHPGRGPCKFHFGTTPALEIAVLKAESLEFAKSLANEKDINPIEALLWAVRLSAGATEYWFDTLSQLPEGTPAEFALAIEEAYGKERDRLVKTAQVCLQTGLAAAAIKLAERQADLMMIVMEETFEQYGIPKTKMADALAFAADVARSVVASGFGD